MASAFLAGASKAVTFHQVKMIKMSEENVDRLVVQVLRFRKSGIRRLRSELLLLTVTEALRTPFYRSLWSDVDPRTISLDTLSELPLVTRDAVGRAGRAAQARDDLVCDEVFTMGTTAPPLVTVRGDREQRFITAYFQGLNSSGLPSRHRRALKFSDPYHGYHVKVPARLHCHRVSIYDAGSFEHARAVLLGVHSDRMVEDVCTELIGGARCLRAFTVDTLAKYPGGFHSSLRCVVSIGEYLTDRWRGILERTWMAPVVDQFSLSEIFGGATQSPVCGWWHFDEYVIPEVISSRMFRPIREGTGFLVLTALYPFQEAQPLVRYLTGDLVEVTHTKSSRPGSLAIKPLGRGRYGIPAPNSDEWLLTPASVLEVTDEIKWVKRAPLFIDAKQVKDPYSIGIPVYELTYSEEQTTIRIVLRIALDARSVTSGLAKIQEGVIADLCRANLALERSIRNGSAQLDIIFDSSISGDDISRSG